MAVIVVNYGKRPLGLGGGGTGNAFQTLQMRVDYRDVSSIATHKLLDLPAGAFVTRCYFAIETLWVTGTSATMQIQESTGANVTFLSLTDGTAANMTAGSVLGSPTGDGSDVLSNVAGHADAFDTSARTVDFKTTTGTWTAGVGVLVVEFVEIPQ